MYTTREPVFNDTVHPVFSNRTHHLVMSNKLYRSIVWPPSHSGLSDDYMCAEVLAGQNFGAEEGHVRNEGEASYEVLESSSGEVVQ